MRKICCQIAVKTRNNPDTNQPKPLLASLELYWGTSKMFGMPKGGLARACLLLFIGVLHVLFPSCCCPLRCLLVCSYPPV